MFVELATAIAIFGMALVYLAIGVFVCKVLAYHSGIATVKKLLLDREALTQYKIDLKEKGDKKDLLYKSKKRNLLDEVKGDLEG